MAKKNYWERKPKNSWNKLYPQSRAYPSQQVKSDSAAALDKTGATIVTDSMVNVVSSLGVEGKAKTPSSRFQDPIIFSPLELGYTYAGCGLFRKIIDAPASEMVREWIRINGDKDNIFQFYLDKLHCQTSFGDLIRWARLYGGAIIIMGINDGRELDQPVNLNSIKAVEFLRVVDRSQLFLYPQDYYMDPESPKFGQVERYTVRPITYGVPNEQSILYRVHESRVLRLDGNPMPDWMRRLNWSWGAPVLQSIYWDLIDSLQTYSYSSELVHDFVTTILSINNLTALLQTETGEAMVRKRINTINYSKSIINSVFIDADKEKFEKVSSSVTGLPELLSAFDMKLSAVVEIPYMVLFSKSASGLNATGDNEVRTWYDQIKMKQEQQLRPLIQKLMRYITLAKDCEFKGDFDQINFEFVPLWQYEEKDTVAMRYQQAQTDAIYLQWGVLNEDEVKTSRFTDAYSFETKIENDNPMHQGEASDNETREQIEQSEEKILVSNKKAP